jgi:hypothetical protein
MASVGGGGANAATTNANAGNPLTAMARGGDASGARLALEAARACIAANGVSARRADALVEMGARHVMLEAALQDLGHVPGKRLGAAPAAALESACRSLAAVAGPHADALAEASPAAAAAADAVAALAAAAPPAVVQSVPSAAAGAAAVMDVDPFADLAGGGAAAATTVATAAAAAVAPAPSPLVPVPVPLSPAAGGGESPVVGAETLARVIRCVEAVFQRVAGLRQPALLPPPLLDAAASASASSSAAASNSAAAADVSAAAAALPDMRCPSAACSVGLYKLDSVYPWLESAWFQP